MSSFNCEHCGEAIIDTPNGFITGCEHYPEGRRMKKKGGPKKYEIEYKLREPSKVRGTLFDRFTEWQSYRKYKTKTQRDQALQALNNKDKFFIYREAQNG